MSGSIHVWSTTPASNDAADAAINWAEFMAPDQVNDSARQMMGRIAEYIADTTPKRASTGAANTYAVTISSSPAALTDGLPAVFVAHQANTGASTLAVNSLGAVALRSVSGSALRNGEIQSGQTVIAFYKSATNEFLIANGAPQLYALYSSILSANSFGLSVGDVKLSLASSPDAGFVRLTDSVQNLVKADYPDLHTWVAAQSYPWGSASTTFGIPAAGGYFLRFGASGSSIDPGGVRTPGTSQTELIKTHTHTGTTSSDGAHTHTVGSISLINVGGGATSMMNGSGSGATTTSSNGAHTHTMTTNTGDSGTGAETRPINVTMYADMLAKPALVASGLIGAVGFAYQFSTGTSGDPGSGYYGYDNATISSATTIRISTTDYNGRSIGPILAALTSGTGIIQTKVGTPATYAYCKLASTPTDNSTYYTFTITGPQSAGTISNGDRFNVITLGETGATGSTGAAAPAFIDYTFDTSSTADSDPGAGKWRANNATPASVTTFYVDDTDRLGNSQAAELATWDDSTSSGVKGKLYLVDLTTPANRWTYDLTAYTAASGYSKLTVTHRAGTASFAAVNIGSLFVPRGDKGADGAGSGDVSGPASAVSNTMVRYDGTTGKLIKAGSTVYDDGSQVGIGTTSPSAPLHVYGVDNGYGVYIERGGLGVGVAGGENGRITVRKDTDAAWPIGLLQNLSTGNSAQVQLFFDRYTAAGVLTRWQLASDVNNNSGWPNLFNIEALDAVGVVSTPLSLSRDGRAGIGDVPSSDTGLNLIGDLRTKRAVSGTVDGNIFLGNGTTCYIFGGPSSNVFAVGVNGSERIRINSSGQLGIGTTSPSFLLHVSGTARITTVELGHDSDTTIARSSAGVISVEGETVHTNSTSRTVTAAGVEIGHATDTTVARASAGVLTVEGNEILSTATTGTGATSGFRALANGISTTQGAIFYRDGSQWTALSPGTAGQLLKTGGASANPSWATTREVLTANRTYYVRSDGSDSNAGTANTSGGAFLTIQKALNVVAALDIVTYSVGINVADGSYTGGASVVGPWVGSGTVTLTGNTTTPSNVTLTGGVSVSSGGRLQIEGFKLLTAGILLYATSNGVITATNLMEFGTATTAQVAVDSGGSITFNANYTISATGGNWHYLSNGGTITATSRTVTISGTPAYAAAFALATRLGRIVVDSMTFSGTGATGPRYSIDTGAVIYTASGGASYLPGNSAGSGGTTTGGGIYA